MSDISPKLTEEIKALEAENKPFISIEFFPPRTEVGITSLYKTLETYKKYDVLFADFTWGAGGSSGDLTLKLCQDTKTKFGLNPNMHLTCTNMPLEKVDHALASCKESGITNILALRGDPPAGETVWHVAEGGLSCALDLVKYIRSKYDDFFCITVAGYPEGHPVAMSVYEGAISDLSATEQNRYSVDVQDDGSTVINVCRDATFDTEIAYLKSKITAGADVIITQMFFDVQVFKDFVNRCRAEGINVPIIPGIMSISNYGGFKRMAKFCKTRVAKELEERMEALKDDADGIKQFGVEFGVRMCKELLEFGVAGLHFYTLNTVGVTTAIIEQLGYMPTKVTSSDVVELVGAVAAIATA